MSVKPGREVFRPHRNATDHAENAVQPLEVLSMLLHYGLLTASKTQRAHDQQHWQAASR